MLYEYVCHGCGKSYEIAKPVVEFNKDEHCPTSGTTMARAIAPVRLHFYGTKVQEKKWQPAIGQAMTDREIKEHAKTRGWIEVGNENLDKHYKPVQSEYPSFSDDEIRAITGKP